MGSAGRVSPQVLAGARGLPPPTREAPPAGAGSRRLHGGDRGGRPLVRRADRRHGAALYAPRGRCRQQGPAFALHRASRNPRPDWSGVMLLSQSPLGVDRAFKGDGREQSPTRWMVASWHRGEIPRIQARCTEEVKRRGEESCDSRARSAAPRIGLRRHRAPIRIAAKFACCPFSATLCGVISYGEADVRILAWFKRTPIRVTVGPASRKRRMVSGPADSRPAGSLI